MSKTNDTSRVDNIRKAGADNDSTTRAVGHQGKKILNLKEELEHSQGRKENKVKEEIDKASDPT